MYHKSSIYPFLGIALFAHAALALTFLKSESQFNISPQDNTGISVTLTKNTISVLGKKISQEEKTKHVIKKPTKTDKHTEVSNLEKIEIEGNKEHKSIDSSSKIITQIREEIKYYFYYPRIAQLKNWQGTVTLNLNINKNGEINSISLLKSSGYSLLDNAALEVLNKIKNKNFLTHIVKTEKIIQLPVTYQLTEG